MKRRDQEYVRRKTGDGAIREKRKTEAEMDGLCQLRHESYRDNKIMRSMTELAGGELCLLQRPPQLSVNG